MILLTTSEDAQQIKVIPRNYATSVTLKLRDESKNTIDTYSSVAATNVKGYLTLSNAFSLVEGRFYELTILDGTDVIYRDRIFCTDQDVDQATNDYYSVNKNVYTAEDSYDNEFIVI